MPALSEHQLLVGLVAVAVILFVGRGTAEVARRLGQPEVLGELLGGFLLGPSVLGALVPSVYHGLFLEHTVGTVLSSLSWIGAILLLMIAGLEVDLDILRAEAKPGALGAALAIVPSLAAGALFAAFVLGRKPLDSLFLGVVLSVTAVSVAAKILIERDALRRGYAQVILAAGVASEVLVWLLVSVVASFKGGSPLEAGVRSFVFAIIFFAFMMTVGQRFTFWAMRRMADLTQIVNGQLSLVVVLTFLSAALTQRLELHALLGAFVFGVLLGRAPRAGLPLKGNVQALTIGFFAPIFFVLAGMRVDIFRLGHPSAIGFVLLLFVVATTVKVGFGALGARLGGLSGWGSALVGVGLNLKGGTDVIVAILGAQLGLLSAQAYAMYAVVAILTVLVSPPIMTLLEPKVPPTEAEMARLNREEAKRRAYLPTIERVVVPLMPRLLPVAVASVVETIAAAKDEEDEFFDIAELTVSEGEQPAPDEAAMAQARGRLEQAEGQGRVERTGRKVEVGRALQTILAASNDHTLIAIGAHAPAPGGGFSLGALQDRIIDEATGDILAVVFHGATELPRIERILVPINGFEYAMKAADVGAYVAKATGAELVLFTVVRPELDPLFWQERERPRLLATGYRTLREVTFRIARLGVRLSQRVVVGSAPDKAVVRELRRQSYQLVVLGAVERGADDQVYLGSLVQSVLTETNVPAIVVITHERSAGQAAAA